ncbi:MAG: hypothetical protein RI953_2105, partial [Pseudomonadota bacterium]
MTFFKPKCHFPPKSASSFLLGGLGVRNHPPPKKSTPIIFRSPDRKSSLYKPVFRGQESSRAFCSAHLQRSLPTAVLQPQSPIESITVLNPELHGPRFSSKASRLDLHIRLQNGTLVDIEVQTSHDAQFIKRSLYYTFQMIGGELKKGEGYEKLPNLAGIYIFDENVFPDILRLDFIELRKISSLNPKENPLFSAWVQFLGAKSAEDLQRAART